MATRTRSISVASLFGRKIKGVILDITGVLKEGGSNGGTAVANSIEALNRLQDSGLAIRFCTNETTVTRSTLVDILRKLGFTIDEKKVFPPIPAMCCILRERNLRPHLLVHPDALPDFDGIDQTDPNCVIIGDATHQFSYENMNKAFQCLMKLEKPILFALGKGKYYQEDGELVLDVGPFLKALEYATDVRAEIVGKPSPSFYKTVLLDMGLDPSEVVMVGDDIVGDVGGAQSCGMAGVLVRTGKFRKQDENHPDVKPDAIMDNLAQFVDKLLSHALS
ncbi:phospholysine phosphohistidine inorganic pyrophosphate phosphatase-like [Physella acuta]|uniref:phospholysine phosphohistidine inorganic pyrophosphate phosphatase-like n=1 Tax=Physella acuta TaxID=109671 RepID=UPI0027DD4597|nr:phospholysine phosphohistidine inorganic pyrophosphate phosphatase-like [Physella acuta]